MPGPTYEFHVSIDGLTGLRDRLHETRRTFRPAAQREVLIMAAELEREGKIRAPQPPGLHGYSRGTLRRSIHFVPIGDLGAKIGPSAGYGKFVEFGTGVRGSHSRVTPFAGYHYGPSAGMDAQPYMVPALEHLRPDFERRLRRFGLGIITGLARPTLGAE